MGIPWEVFYALLIRGDNMRIQLKDLQPNVSGIYKITFPNGKIYIGMSNDIKRRMSEHNSPSENFTVCDKAINKYGKITEIEILEIVSDLSELEEKEQKWIAYFNSTNREIGYNISAGGVGASSGENNHKAVFTNEEVLDIRRRRFEGERKVDVYNDYSDRSFSSFEGVWLGRGYVDIGKEYFIKPNSISRQEYSSKANSGEKNNKAKLTEIDVVNIRKQYNSGMSELEISKGYPFVTLKTIRRVCRKETWKSVK